LILQLGQDHNGKLEAFGLMDGQNADRVIIGLGRWRLRFRQVACAALSQPADKGTQTVIVVVGEMGSALYEHAQIGLSSPHLRRLGTDRLGLQESRGSDDVVDQLRQAESLQVAAQLGQ